MEASLWAALRALEENANLKHRVAERLRGRGNTRSTRRLELEISRTEAQARQIRTLLERPTSAPETENET